MADSSRITSADETAWSLLGAVVREFPGPLAGEREALTSDVGRAVLSSSPEIQAAFVRVVVDRIGELRDRLGPPVGMDYRYMNLCREIGFPYAAVLLVVELLRRRLPFSAADLVLIARRIADLGAVCQFALPHLGPIVGVLERHVKTNGTSARLGQQIRRMIAALDWVSNAPERRVRLRLTRLLEAPAALPLDPGEAWGDRTAAEVNALPADCRAPWLALLEHCAAARSGSPSPRWETEARRRVEAVGWHAFQEAVAAWLPLVDQPRTAQTGTDWRWEANWPHFISERNADVLRGLAWCCGLQEDATLARSLTALAISAYRRLPGIGPRLVKVGNACLWTLGHMPGMEGVYQLALLKVKVRFGTAQKLIDKAFEACAARVGLPRDEVEEIAVPAYGLAAGGRRIETLGGYTVELAVAARDHVELTWKNPAGKALKSVPAAVKAEHADEVRDVTQAARDIQKMLPAQRERIDRLHLTRRSWPIDAWRERYLDHPLVGTIAQRVVWRFTTDGGSVDGAHLGGALVDVRDRPIDRLPPAAQVELWHPIGRPGEDVLAWRGWLERHQVRQPFKQAHREIYVLTDAERAARHYSNRFAGHILRQHQFNALCAARGWRNRLRLLVDQELPPATLLLPQWNLRTEFWIEGVGDDYGRDTNDSGAFHFISTDQLRFYPLDAATMTAHAGGGGYATRGGFVPEAIPLEDIPPLVFSEVMRDVDLFVGVASVGNDPTWRDGGPDGRFGAYWSSYAFGPLGETARTRKAVLETIIPRLAIAERCALDDKFLVVRGDLRTYKIHLGSANILMSPNDRYLCIVPGRSAAAAASDRLYLPFEGDERLAVILSKALLLAADTKITDPSIVSQIRAK